MKARRRRLKKHRKAPEQNNGHAVAETVIALPAPSLIMLPREHVFEVWPLVGDYINAAARWGEFSAVELQNDARTGRAQLWLAWSEPTNSCEAAAITRVIETPLGDVCTIAACGGKDLDNWLCLLDDLEKWAKGQGCVQMRIYGRKGWARKLKDYQTTRLVLDKDL